MISALRKFFGAGSMPAREGLPEGLRIYAVGDIHGRVDLLRMILEAAQARVLAEGLARNEAAKPALKAVSG